MACIGRARLIQCRRWGGVDRSDLIWLTEAQLLRIEPYFPLSHGVPRVDDRRIISGIIFVIRNAWAGVMHLPSTGHTRRSTHIHVRHLHRCNRHLLAQSMSPEPSRRRSIMGISDLAPGALGRLPRNAGNMVGAKRPLKPRDVCMDYPLKFG